jgi:alpha-beta hydrolase superfamily lysophospholipase
MIKPTRLALDSKTGQGPLQADLYQPAAGGLAPCFLMLVVHGMAEHRQRYAPFARWLAARGGIVCLYDQAGHGESAPSADKLGFFAEEKGDQAVLADVDQFCDYLQKLAPDLPLILFGHSMGSLILRDYCATYQRPLAGVIWSGTSGPNPAQGLGSFLTTRSIRRHGPLFRDPLLDRLLHMGFLSHIPKPRTPFDWLSKDSAVVDAYIADPHCGYIFTTGGMKDLIAWTSRVSSPAWAAKVPSKLPILLLSGSTDPVGQYGRGARTVHRWLVRTNHPAALNIYASGRHEMLLETNFVDVYADIWRWIEQSVLK